MTKDCDREKKKDRETARKGESMRHKKESEKAREKETEIDRMVMFFLHISEASLMPSTSCGLLESRPMISNLQVKRYLPDTLRCSNSINL